MSGAVAGCLTSGVVAGGVAGGAIKTTDGAAEAEPSPVETPPAGRWRALVLLACAELLCMSLWFSASAVVPALQAEWRLTEAGAGLLTLAVQLGFVAGTLLSALLNLPDIISTRRLVVAAAACAAAVNAAFGLFAHDLTTGVGLRFLVGLFLAGVYPPGMIKSLKPKKYSVINLKDPAVSAAI